MKWLVLILTLATSAASAQAVIVKSGDHADFTRLVLTFPGAVDWKIGRTETGYELEQSNKSAPFDLSGVYQLITKARLKSIWADPDSGNLQLGVACECHVIPFEFNGNTLVVDIRNGPPPTSSVFEQRIVGEEVMPPLGQIALPVTGSSTVPRSTYDWLETRVGSADTNISSRSVIDTVKQPLFETALQGDSFRMAVLEQVAKGATGGVVNIIPGNFNAPTLGPPNALENARVILSDQMPDLSGVTVSDGSTRPSLTESGDICPDAERVDVGKWASADTGFDKLVAAREGILGEFDQPESDSVLLALRLHLFLGFGAESRDLMRAFQPIGEHDPLMVGISYLVDGQSALEFPFVGMQTCDSSAAFWTLAAWDSDETLSGLNGNAVARAFMSLPRHLKIVFAQTIADRLLRAGDAANAEVVRSALARSVPANASIIQLLDAERALLARAPLIAEGQLSAITDTSMAADTLLALVETRFQQLRPLDDKNLIALEAFAFENQMGVRKEQFRQALAHAKALAGSFAEAFALAGEDSQLRRDTWVILAELGQDSDLLTHVAGGTIKEDDLIPASTKAKFVRRLVELGLPNAAETWLPQHPENPLLEAEVALANKDGRAALRALATLSPQADATLLAQAFREIGDLSQAADVLRNVGKTEEARRIERWAGSWNTETQALIVNSTNVQAPDGVRAADDVWEQLASLRQPETQKLMLKPLEASRSHLEMSGFTQDRIADLLNSVSLVTR